MPDHYRETLGTFCIIHHFMQSNHHSTSHVMRYTLTDRTELTRSMRLRGQMLGAGAG